MAFEVNGTGIGTVALKRGPAEYRIDVPAATLVAGENELGLGFSAACHLAPHRERLTAGWESLRIRAAEVSEGPRQESTGDSSAIILPFGSQVDFYLSLPAPARLAIERISPWGEGHDGTHPATVLLETRSADDPEPRVLDLLAGGKSRGVVEAPLTGGRAAPMRLSLRAVRASAESAAAGGFRLRGPTVLMRGSEAEIVRRRELPAGRRAGVRRRPNVVLYLVDTLRADHLGVYGYHRPTSPHIDAFAHEATLFTRALAQTSWTRPAVATLLTGLHPLTHGVNERDHALPESPPVLAQILRDLGYQTVGVTTNVNVYSTFGFDRGYQQYVELPYMRDSEIHQPSEEVNRSVFRQLDGMDPGQPFFLFVHTMDPHAPYSPPDSLRRRFGAPAARSGLGSIESFQRIRRMENRGEPTDHLRPDLMALYDAEIARNDASFGALLEELRARGLYESSLIVFVSDHGEAFGEQGEWAHGSSLFRNQLEIPLIIKLPQGEGAGEVVAELAGQVDVLPTVLDYLGEELPPGVQGRSLLARGAGAAAPYRREVSTFYLRKDGTEIESLQIDGWKLIRYRLSRRPKDGLYRLATDPDEAVNLIDRERIWRGFLDSELRMTRRGWTSDVEIPEAIVGEDQLDQLRALGYIR